jgi:hypothetical protein
MSKLGLALSLSCNRRSRRVVVLHVLAPHALITNFC